MIDKSDNTTINNPTSYVNQPPAKKPRGAGFALFIAFLALFFTAAGIAAGYKHWQRMSDRAKANARDITVLEEVIAAKSDNNVIASLRTELNDSQAAQKQSISHYLTQMKQMHSQTEQFSSTVASQVKQVTSLQGQLQSATAPKTSADWQIAEIGFLLKLASRELHLSGNKEAAGRALREADKILSENGSTRYVLVRQQIGNDLAALESMEVADISLLSQRITALGNKLKPVLDDALPPEMNADSSPDTKKAAAPGDKKETNSTWNTYKNKAVNMLNDAVIIRQLDKSLTKELSVEAREQAYQLLQLRLEALRLMALQQRDKAYQQQIELIRTTVNTYYPAEQNADIHTILDELSAVTLKAELPDISGSQAQLEQARIAEVNQ
uniref:Uncharacterized protein n=1 Tax=uncultured Thiotrichaceae bacterium TaxID=298394 RepID=A0A6S6UEF9_9GAMM|nr:MAG: Unknown protein [uncultured Thiotrichaceae bacterium]